MRQYLSYITNPAIDKTIGGDVMLAQRGDFIPKLALFITNFVKIAFVIAGVAFFFMLIWGGFEYITAGGDKERVGTATKRMSNAMIGMVILLSSYALFRLVNQIFGINVLNLVIPVIQ